MHTPTIVSSVALFCSSRLLAHFSLRYLCGTARVLLTAMSVLNSTDSGLWCLSTATLRGYEDVVYNLVCNIGPISLPRMVYSPSYSSTEVHLAWLNVGYGGFMLRRVSSGKLVNFWAKPLIFAHFMQVFGGFSQSNPMAGLSCRSLCSLQLELKLGFLWHVGVGVPVARWHGGSCQRR